MADPGATPNETAVAVLARSAYGAGAAAAAAERADSFKEPASEQDEALRRRVEAMPPGSRHAAQELVTAARDAGYRDAGKRATEPIKSIVDMDETGAYKHRSVSTAMRQLRQRLDRDRPSGAGQDPHPGR